MLTDIKMPPCYFTATSEKLLKEFYLPALTESSLYQRGVAYFSISLLLGLLDGVIEFVSRGGVIHLATSVELDEATVKAFASGYTLSEREVEQRLLEVIEEYRSASVNSYLNDDIKLDVIANMIASRHLVIKVAYVPSGLYHEKIGIFSDANGNAISFIGSANATVNAYHNNFETINVFSSWKMKEIVDQHREHFTDLWNDAIDSIRVMSFPEAVEKKFLDEYRKSPTLKEALERMSGKYNPPRDTGKTADDEVQIRDYQEEAISQFVKNGYRHFYEMATGTGKTFTAIKSIERMMETHPLLNVVILVPLRDLQDQWLGALKHFFKEPNDKFRFGGGSDQDPLDYELSVETSRIGNARFAAIAVCVYDTFFSKIVFRSKPICGEVLLVVDEAHNLTPSYLAMLQRYTLYRLGLSATPQRYSEDESEAILRYFLKEGVESFKFGLEDAIKRGFLSPYEYYPVPVSLTDDEQEQYDRLTKNIGVAQAICDKDPSRENRKKLDDLKMQRSRVVKKASCKIAKLLEMVESGNYDFANAVVFCAEGKINLGDEYGEQKIIDFVTKALSSGKHKRYYPAKYTSGENDRPARLENFKEGITDALVAIKCFDEGMDVPALDKIYIMASDSSMRQTIQRRGRVLRISKATGKEKALIYDFVTGSGSGFGFVPLLTELPRVHEYARLSLNPEASNQILMYYDPITGNNQFDETLQEE